MTNTSTADTTEDTLLAEARAVAARAARRAAPDPRGQSLVSDIVIAELARVLERLVERVVRLEGERAAREGQGGPRRARPLHQGRGKTGEE